MFVGVVPYRSALYIEDSLTTLQRSFFAFELERLPGQESCVLMGNSESASPSEEPLVDSQLLHYTQLFRDLTADTLSTIRSSE